MVTMPEERIQPLATARYRDVRYPNFVGGSGDPNQPGTPSQLTPATPPTTPGGGGGGTPATPRTRLGQLVAPSGGDGGKGKGPRSPQDPTRTPEGTESEIDRYRRGRAALTAENVGRALSFGFDIASPAGIVKTVAGEAIKELTGEDVPGLGLPEYEGYQAPTDEGMAGLQSGQYATAAEAQAADDAAGSLSENTTTNPNYTGAGKFGAGSSQSGGGGGEDRNFGKDLANDVGGFKGAGAPSADTFSQGGTVTGLEFKRAGPVDPNSDPSLGLNFQRAGPVDPNSAQWVAEQAQRIMQRPQRSWTAEEATLVRQYQAITGSNRGAGVRGYAQGGTVPRAPMPGEPVRPRRMGNPANTDPVRPLPAFIRPPMARMGNIRRDGPNHDGYAAGGTVDKVMSYDAGGPVVDPAAVPDDGVVDNQPINADEGEFVIQRAAAEVLGPDALRAINDPQMAPEIAAVINDYLARTRSSRQVMQPTHQPGSAPAQRPMDFPRPTTRLGQLRAG